MRISRAFICYCYGFWQIFGKMNKDITQPFIFACACLRSTCTFVRQIRHDQNMIWRENAQLQSTLHVCVMINVQLYSICFWILLKEFFKQRCNKFRSIHSFLWWVSECKECMNLLKQAFEKNLISLIVCDFHKHF